MGCQRWMRNLTCPVFLLLAACGCQTLSPCPPVTVRVEDAETHEPIPGASVRLWYPLTQPSSPTRNSTATTEMNGTAQLRVVSCGNAGVMLEVSASGHLTEEKNLCSETIHVTESAHGRAASTASRADVVMELYSEPRPRIELIVPDGYRGLVKIEIQIEDDAPLEPGKRSFSQVVSDAGMATIEGPALLRHLSASDFGARYVDGTLLNHQPKPLEIGLRWLKNDGAYQYFVVGDQSDFDECRRCDERESMKPQRSYGGGRGEGQGRRKRGRGAS